MKITIEDTTENIDELRRAIEYWRDIKNWEDEKEHKQFTTLVSKVNSEILKQTKTAPKSFIILEIETGKELTWTLEQILQEINRDHNEEWIPYDATDWQEGWINWVEGQYYSMIYYSMIDPQLTA